MTDGGGAAGPGRGAPTPSRPSAERGGLDGVCRRLPETSASMVICAAGLFAGRLCSLVDAGSQSQVPLAPFDRAAWCRPIDPDPDDIRVLSRSSASVFVGTGPLACHRRHFPRVASSPSLLLAPQARLLVSSRRPRSSRCLNGSFARQQLQGAPLHTIVSGRPHTMPLSTGLLPPRRRSLIHPSSHAPNLARQTQPNECLLFGAAAGRAHVSGARLNLHNLSVGSSTSCRCSSHKRNRLVRAASRPAPRALMCAVPPTSAPPRSLPRCAPHTHLLSAVSTRCAGALSAASRSSLASPSSQWWVRC